eukprot:gene13151-17485_t
MLVLKKLRRYWHKVIKVFADGGYRGKLEDKVTLVFKYILRIVKRSELHTFKVLPKRWIVERTFAWIDTNRRTAKSYERYTDTVEAVTQIAVEYKFVIEKRPGFVLGVVELTLKTVQIKSAFQTAFFEFQLFKTHSSQRVYYIRAQMRNGMNKIVFLSFLILFSAFANAQTPAEDSAYLLKNYVKIEKLVPMRDGTKLFTAIYMPKDSVKKHPVLMVRTPYSCAPYGDTAFRKFWDGYQQQYK